MPVDYVILAMAICLIVSFVSTILDIQALIVVGTNLAFALVLILWSILSVVVRDIDSQYTYNVPELSECKVIEIYKAEYSLGIKYDILGPIRGVKCEDRMKRTGIRN